jgi:hypothetical protein
MKKTGGFILFLAAILLSTNSFSQSLRDTIVTKSNDSIVCKITKISDYDVEYVKTSEPDAIGYVISKDKIRMLMLRDGTHEVIMRDEMEMNAESEILDKRQAVKFHFFSPFYDHLAVTYERSLKMGTNVEASVGFINNSMFDFSVFESYDALTQGAFIKFGPKFNLGNSYYMKGMKYSHPLKGKYFKPEIILTSFAVRDVNINYSTYDPNYYYTITNSFITDVTAQGLALTLNFGNQYILGNMMTFGFNVGVGYSFVRAQFTNQELNDYIANNGSNNNTYFYNYYYSSPYNYTNKMYSHTRSGEKSGIAFQVNLTLGYIFK